MPYAIDFADLEQKLFLVQQLLYASESFCAQNKLSQFGSKIPRKQGDFRESARQDIEWGDYSSRLEHYISNSILECAIKTRVAQDFISKHDEVDIADIDRSACSGVALGQFEDGTSLVSIRESCNKIVHATSADLGWQTFGEVGAGGYQYWNGYLNLAGDKFGTEWRLSLSINDWCEALKLFHTLLGEAVDWDNVYGI